MTDLFSSANYPETEPTDLVIGDRWAWKRTDLGLDYAPASYALTYEAVIEGDDQSRFTITASESGSDYLAEVASATTAAYEVGTYHWTAFITRSSDSERVQVESGTWTITANPATDTSDPRTHVKIVLDALEALIEGKATSDQMSYTIGTRSLSRFTPTELREWCDIYRHRQATIVSRERVAQGLGSRRKVRVMLP